MVTRSIYSTYYTTITGITDYLDYEVYSVNLSDSSTALIGEGEAYPFPGENYVGIDLRPFARALFDSTVQIFTSSGETVEYGTSYVCLRLVASGVSYEDILFVNDWSYENSDGEFSGDCLSDPVNGHVTMGMFFPYTTVQTATTQICYTIVPRVEAFFEFTPSAITGDHNAINTSLTIYSNVQWTASTDSSHITISTLTGFTGYTQMTVGVAANTGTTDYSNAITFNAIDKHGDYSTSVPIEQTHIFINTYWEGGESTKNVSYVHGTAKLYVESNDNWTITGATDWVTLSASGGTSGITEITVNYRRNESEESARTATFVATTDTYGFTGTTILNQAIGIETCMIDYRTASQTVVTPTNSEYVISNTYDENGGHLELSEFDNPVDLLSGNTDLTYVYIRSGITGVGTRAFSSCTSLSEVVIGEDVKTINQYAFYHCTALTSLTLGESVTRISACAFEDCSHLPNVVFPSGLTRIDYNAFDDCVSLTELTLPAATVGEYAFAGCDNLSVVVFSGTTAHSRSFYYVSNLETVITTGNNTYLYDIFDIQYYSDKPVKNVIIGGTNTHLWYTFGQCENLTNVTITDPSPIIDSRSFRTCKSLTEITLPSGTIFSGNTQFATCYALSSVTLENGITAIGEHVFENCTALTGITIPDSVTTIGKGTFSLCTALTGITIPDSVTTIGEEAFYKCTALTGITIPDSVTTIGDNAFSGCTSLSILNIGSGVTTIGDIVFTGCPIENLTVDCPTIYPTMAPSTISSVTIGSGVTAIGAESDTRGAFYNCTALTSITIPNSVTIIYGAFVDCTGLTGITIPDSVTTISNSFYGCTALTSITIPNSVTIIDVAFGHCTGLTGITIPDSVTTISNSFYGCSALVEINTYTTTPTFTYYSFYGIGANGTLHCPSGSDYSRWASKLPSTWTFVDDL